MQYLVSVIDDKSDPGSTDRQPAISAFNERLIAEGYWVFAGGLAGTDAATVIDNRGEQPVFSDGPLSRAMLLAALPQAGALPAVPRVPAREPSAMPFWHTVTAPRRRIDCGLLAARCRLLRETLRKQGYRPPDYHACQRRYCHPNRVDHVRRVPSTAQVLANGS